ncbi:SIS domain-containing protein [Streptomyces sp. NPDC059071]|uniref:D-sedoheptulose-7-phosphate isomerase n=1 Tax=unclassified Streptomyces TaxID=2593676 RepID=UPI00362EFA9F
MNESQTFEDARLHCQALCRAVDRLDGTDLRRLSRWGRHLAAVLTDGGRLLAAGNGGSAAQAQHLTAELVGRYREDRPAYSALSLHAETSSVTAIGNDYGFEQVFARQVAAHGRAGDLLMLLSTSGRSPNLLSAAMTARSRGLDVWALTGPAPNPLAEAADDALTVDAATTATVQEAHLVVVHLLCEFFDASLVGALGGHADRADPAAADRASARAAGASAAADGSPVPGAPAGLRGRSERAARDATPRFGRMR